VAARFYLNNRDHKIAMLQNSEHQNSDLTDLLYTLFNVKNNLLYRPKFSNIKLDDLLYKASNVKLRRNNLKYEIFNFKLNVHVGLLNLKALIIANYTQMVSVIICRLFVNSAWRIWLIISGLILLYL